ncbi:zinc transporter ZIP3-like [Tachypleus tridentatus]|uniref:zinc transporter ZIP3-like n=1 Tax=Tachypleus tridentatus TaxID=6853 RepID=UPI003FD206BA
MFAPVNMSETLEQLNQTYLDQMNVSTRFPWSKPVKKNGMEYYSGVELVTAQIVSSMGMFGSMLASFMVPYFCVARWPQTMRGLRYQLALSLANCFSGGVFMATFFVGLLPEVRKMFQLVLELKGIHTNIPITECMVFVGFVLALLIEQVALNYQENKTSVRLPSSNGFINLDKKDWCDKETNSDPDRSKRLLKSESRESLLSEANHSTDEEEMYLKARTLSNHINEVSGLESASSYQDYEDKQETSSLTTVGSGHTASHGHSHADIGNLIYQESGVRFILLVLSLTIHSIFEGLALGLQNDVVTLFNLFLGVAIHELLVAFSMGVNVARLRLSRAATFLFSVLFSASIPVGQIVGLCVGSNQSIGGQTVSAVLQAIAAGTFIHVTFMEVIPCEFKDSGHRLIKVFFLFIGFLSLLGCTVALNEGAGHTH